MSEKQHKAYKNVGKNTYHIKARAKGRPYHEFHPGAVLRPVDDEEAALFERTENIVPVEEPAKAPEVAPEVEDKKSTKDHEDHDKKPQVDKHKR